MQFVKVFVTFGKAIRELLFASQIIGAFFIDAFMYAENGTFFGDSQGMATMRAFEDNRLVVLFTGNEGTGADRALELSFAAIIVVEVFMGGATTGTYVFDRNISFGVFADGDGFDKFAVAFMEIPDEFLVIILFLFDDDR